MSSLLIRVGVDQSRGGGFWNGPVRESGDFAYVAIPETREVCPGMEKPYAALEPVLSRFGVTLPPHLRLAHMHLDPDFTHLTYGDQGERANQLCSKLSCGDMIAFYAGLADVRGNRKLVYAIIGLFVVNDIVPATSVPATDRDTNAHTRRILAENSTDIVVRARPGVSGRLRRCLPIGEWRDRAYRVRSDLLEIWGGLSVKDGYLQRSARLPEFLDPGRFIRWLDSQSPTLVQTNN